MAPWMPNGKIDFPSEGGPFQPGLTSRPRRAGRRVGAAVWPSLIGRFASVLCLPVQTAASTFPPRAPVRAAVTVTGAVREGGRRDVTHNRPPVILVPHGPLSFFCFCFYFSTSLKLKRSQEERGAPRVWGSWPRPPRRRVAGPGRESGLQTRLRASPAAVASQARRRRGGPLRAPGRVLLAFVLLCSGL